MGSQLNIAICDDDQRDLTTIDELTRSILQSEGIIGEIVCYESSRDLLEVITNGERFHLLLLDVQMDELGGIELAAALRKQKNKTAIVFISSNLEMALRGYEVSASRYLAKPVDPERLREALLYCYKEWREKRELLLPTDQGQQKVSASEILYVEAYDRGTRFILTEEPVETRLKFSEAEALLPASLFVLCHRAYLVNLAYVKRIRSCEFELKTGATVPISKHRFPVVNKRFIDYIRD
ncbi:MAG: response regulator transcription factor [Lachnospiraceae bacterium]|nr:response regulator transcription factor [Lachnospiraceae bacterium]